MTFHLRSLAAVLFVLLSAAGCGQRGALYLPGDPDEGRIEIPSQESEEGADEEERSDQSQQ